MPNPRFTPRLLILLILVPVLSACAASAAPQSADDPQLEDMPWISQPDGSPAIDEVPGEPSLVFTAGTDYPEALRELYISVAERGALPPGTSIAEPLPSEVVAVLPADDSQGLRLSLTAPWGWSLDERRIRPPSYALPGSLTPEEFRRRLDEAKAAGRALPEGAAIDIPPMPACQFPVGSVEERPSC